jgi:hypothetical protein
MSYELPIISRHWIISGNIPTPERPHYKSSNFCLGVEAANMDDAIAAVKAKLPEATLYSCTHRGEVHLRA